jgi:HAD superfamily hydrolase (TIGR01509 family)
MTEPRRPRAVLFDSGGVLIQPIGGRWNPRADFEEILAGHEPDLDPERVAAAIVVGDAFLDSAVGTPAYDDYHRVILGALGVEPAAALLAELSRPVEPQVFLEVFPEVIATLGRLRELGVPMAVVSDAWSELPALHDALGLGGFFSAYAISAEVGCTKPDPRMYRHASDALGLAAEDCLFLDDDPDLVAAAMDLGYQGLAVLRGPTAVGRPDVVSIRTIDAILDRFG